MTSMYFKIYGARRLGVKLRIIESTFPIILFFLIGAIIGFVAVYPIGILIMLALMLAVIIINITLRYPSRALMYEVLSLPIFEFLHNELVFRGILNSMTTVLFDRIPLFLMIGCLVVILITRGKDKTQVSSVNVFSIGYLMIVVFYTAFTMVAISAKLALDGLWIDASFLLYFFAGQVTIDELRITYLRRIFTVTSILAVFGILQSLFMGIGGLKLLGLSIYRVAVPNGWDPLWSWANLVRFTSYGFKVRAVSLIGDPLELSSILLMGIVVGVGLYHLAETPRTRTLISIGVVFNIVAEYLTYTRSGWLALAIATIVLIPRLRGLAKSKRVILYLFLTFIVIIILGTVYLLGEFSYDNGSIQAHISSVVRVSNNFWNYLFGTGTGTLSPAATRVHVQGFALVESWYVQIFGELGLGGLLLYLAIVVTLLRTLRRKGYQESKHISILKSIWYSSLLGLLIQSVVIPVWDNSSVTGIMWFGIGLAFQRKYAEVRHVY